MSVSSFGDITKSKPERSLIEKQHKSGGRNNLGRITSFQRGGGHKRRYRRIDFKRDKWEVPGKVAGIEYDPNRSARIALLHYADGEKRYILAPLGLSVGDRVQTSGQADIQPGNTLPLEAIPLGTIVHNIELKPGKGGQMVRAAGGGAQLMAREGKYATLKLPSSEMRRVLARLGKRPNVRGVAMNPVDHPHGGGEGRTAGGRHPVTPWGVPTKGHKTRKKRASSKFIVKRRGKK